MTGPVDLARLDCPWGRRRRAGDERLGLAISQRLDLPDLIGQLLAARNQTLDTAATYLEPRLRDLMPDPASFRDMDKAASRLADAATQAFTPEKPHDRGAAARAALEAAIAQLGPDEARRVLENVG